MRGEHNLSDILTKPIGSEICNRHLFRMQFIFHDANVGLNVCSMTKQHSSRNLAYADKCTYGAVGVGTRTVSFAPIFQIRKNR